jgi:hypothetical protein
MTPKVAYMPVDERVVARLRELISLGEDVLATKRQPGAGAIGFDAFVDSEKANQWFTSSQSLLGRVFGLDGAHYKNFSAIPGKQGISFSPCRRGQGILKAALDDFERGYLFDIRKLVESEVFADFLDQAGELLRAGYKGPAAVVAGAVLEDGLRKLCEKHGIANSDKPKLDAMNSLLAKAGAYTLLTQKRITAIADIRNNAAHGNWDAFETDDVREMIDWVSKFSESQLD